MGSTTQTLLSAVTTTATGTRTAISGYKRHTVHFVVEVGAGTLNVVVESSLDLINWVQESTDDFTANTNQTNVYEGHVRALRATANTGASTGTATVTLLTGD